MRSIAVLAVVGLLGGCGLVPGVAQLEGAFVIGTDKTIEDHVISYYSGKNCSTVRKELGMTYCEEDERRIEPLVYCYKTLGEVTCYDRPDPHHGRQKKIGVNDHNMPTR